MRESLRGVLRRACLAAAQAFRLRRCCCRSRRWRRDHSRRRSDRGRGSRSRSPKTVILVDLEVRVVTVPPVIWLRVWAAGLVAVAVRALVLVVVRERRDDAPDVQPHECDHADRYELAHASSSSRHQMMPPSTRRPRTTSERAMILYTSSSTRTSFSQWSTISAIAASRNVLSQPSARIHCGHAIFVLRNEPSGRMKSWTLARPIHAADFVAHDHMPSTCGCAFLIRSPTRKRRALIKRTSNFLLFHPTMMS